MWFDFIWGFKTVGSYSFMCYWFVFPDRISTRFIYMNNHWGLKCPNTLTEHLIFIYFLWQSIFPHWLLTALILTLCQLYANLGADLNHYFKKQRQMVAILAGMNPTGDAMEGFTPTSLAGVVLTVQVTHTNTALLPTGCLWENISGAACMGQDSSLPPM